MRDDWDYCNTIAHEFGHILGMNDGYGEDNRPEATELNMYDIMRHSHSDYSHITEIDIQMMIMAAITNEEQYFMTYDGYTQSKGATINGACTSE